MDLDAGEIDREAKSLLNLLGVEHMHAHRPGRTEVKVWNDHGRCFCLGSIDVEVA